MKDKRKIFIKALQKILNWLLDPLYGKDQNWQAALVCIAIAAFFWSVHKLNQSYNAKLTYPLAISYDEKQYVPIMELPSKIDVNVSGNGWELLKRSLGFGMRPIVLSPKNLPVSNYISSRRLFTMMDEEIQGMKLNYLETDTLRFFFDKLKTTKLPLKVSYERARLADGLRFADRPFVCQPDSIVLSGPEKQLSSFNNSVMIYLDSNTIIGKPFEQRIDIDLESYPNIKADIESAVVKVKTVEYVSHQLSLPIKMLNFPKDSVYVASDSLVKIRFKMDKDISQNTKSDEMDFMFKLAIDYTIRDSATGHYPVILKKNPAKAYDFLVTPSKIKVDKTKAAK